MRSEFSRWREAVCLALLLSLAGASGCAWLRPGRTVGAADAPQPDAVEDAEPATPPAVEEPPPPAAESPAEEPAAAEGPVPAEEPVPAEATAAADEPAPDADRPSPAPEPAPTPIEPSVDPQPEIDEVSPVDTESPEPRLLPEGEEVRPESLRDDLRRAERLSATLAARELTPELEAQVESGRAFLGDAREALEADDPERAAVLLRKSLVLLEDAVSASAP